MKSSMRLLLILCMIFATMALSAQTERGRFIISGQTSLDFSYSSDNTSHVSSSKGTITQESYSLNITPGVGYFVVDNFAVLLQTSYITENADYIDKMSQFTFTPSLSYYIPTGGTIRPFIIAGAGYANITQHIPIQNNATSRHSFSGYTLSVGLGAAYFINNWISLDLNVEYSDINTSYSGDSSLKIKMNGFSGAIGFSLFL